MPSSTLDRPHILANPSDWAIVVRGPSPVDPPDTAEPTTVPPRIHPATPARRGSVAVPARRRTTLWNAGGRLGLMVGLVVAAVAAVGLLAGRSPLLALGLATPHFVAYQGASAEPVRFVLDDGWTRTAAVPGALLIDWREGRERPALRLTLGNPAAEPEVERLTADGTRIEQIRYRGAWPGVDVVIGAQPGGWVGNFIVEPGVDPAVIELEYVGATELAIDGAGRLHVRSPEGAWIDGLPESWQEGPSGREPVHSRYEPRGGNRFGFVVGPYDPSRPLVVDPPSERSR